MFTLRTLVTIIRSETGNVQTKRVSKPAHCHCKVDSLSLIYHRFQPAHCGLLLIEQTWDELTWIELATISGAMALVRGGLYRIDELLHPVTTHMQPLRASSRQTTESHHRQWLEKE